MASGSSRTMPRSVTSQPSRRSSDDEHEAVASCGSAGRRRLVDGDDLVARREHGDARAREHRRLRTRRRSPRRRELRRADRASRRARGRSAPPRHVAAAPRDEPARRRSGPRRCGTRRAVGSLRLLHGNDAVRAGRQRRAGHDRDGLARAPTPRSAARPAAISPTTVSVAGASRHVRARARRTRPSGSCRTAGNRGRRRRPARGAARRASPSVHAHDARRDRHRVEDRDRIAHRQQIGNVGLLHLPRFYLRR